MNRTTFALGFAALSSFGFVAPLAGCKRDAAVEPASSEISPARLYPLREGSVWSYDVDTGEGLPTLAITRVVKADDTRSEVSSGGEPVVYERRPDGIFRPERGAYLLKSPIVLGARWDAGPGVSAEVTAVDVAAKTESADFRGCVEVTELGSPPGKTVRTLYCPDVGPVRVESTLVLETSPVPARIVAVLRGYDLAPLSP